jgi:hypothetical protein
MKSEFRCALAQQPFEEKIRKVGELIQISRKVKANRTRDDNDDAADIRQVDRAPGEQSHVRNHA